jgi:hypothetical protein
MTEYESPLDRMKRIQQEEADRVEAMIKADKKYRTRENDRKAAELEVAGGRFVNLDETVVEPTAEWMEKGDTATFIPKQPKGTTKVIRSVRRVVTPMVIRMLQAGRITGEQAAACTWYRTQWERAGLSGRVKTAHISLTGNSGSGGGMGQAPMAQHEREVEARLAYRSARDALTPFYIKFFESVVIHDIPVARAARFARCRNDRAPKRFRDTAQELLEHCERVRVIVPEVGEYEDD